MMETTDVVQRIRERVPARPGWLTDYLVPLGRALYASIFVMSGPNHFRRQTINYAASEGVPMPRLLVPLSGLMALAGGLSVLLGYRARAGAALLAGFLVPVTLKMHNFWSVRDPQQAQNQQIHFMKNAAMLGGALLIARFGAGPFSLDAWWLRTFPKPRERLIAQRPEFLRKPYERT